MLILKMIFVGPIDIYICSRLINVNISYTKMKMINWMWGKNSKETSKEQDYTNEQELKKRGFDPQKIQVTESKEDAFCDFDKDYEGYVDPSFDEALLLIQNVKFYPTDDEHRHEFAHPKGGKICADEKQVEKIHSVSKQMLKLIGRKIISGELNLTRISFPIKAMVPKTALQNSTLGCSTLPYFMHKACNTNIPLEKMKYAITSIVSANYYMNLFLKPLNPVIGQTLEGSYADGTQIYCEQISHHPPISYFLVIGPNQAYRYSGYYAFEVSAGLNTLTMVNKGKRCFSFADGTQIQANFSKQLYAGGFIGTIKSESIEGFKLTDQKNQITCEINYGKVKKRPTDFFEGDIVEKGRKVSKFYGSYCGFLDFDGVRYWDGRYIQGFKIKFKEDPLMSDFKHRSDLQTLKLGKIHQAQQEKEKVEQAQRMDARLRQKHRVQQ